MAGLPGDPYPSFRQSQRSVVAQQGEGSSPRRLIEKEAAVNTDILEGNWKELKGRVREKWGELTDDDVDRVNGKRDQLVGVIQQKYGTAKDAAEREVLNFEKDANDWLDARKDDTAATDVPRRY
jgi:uncharacterized protein YjbJ (UPF0337 family)